MRPVPIGRELGHRRVMVMVMVMLVVNKSAGDRCVAICDFVRFRPSHVIAAIDVSGEPVGGAALVIVLHGAEFIPAPNKGDIPDIAVLADAGRESYCVVFGRAVVSGVSIKAGCQVIVLLRGWRVAEFVAECNKS